jgi:hypothetical protein
MGRSLMAVSRATVSEKDVECARTIDAMVELSRVVRGWSSVAGTKSSG